MNKPQTYKRKPTVVQAIQFTGNIDEIEAFNPHIHLKGAGSDKIIKNEKGEIIMIRFETPEGISNLYLGDYLVKGIDGATYPCNKNTFPLVYEKTNSAYVNKDLFTDPNEVEQVIDEEN